MRGGELDQVCEAGSWNRCENDFTGVVGIVADAGLADVWCVVDRSWG